MERTVNVGVCAKMREWVCEREKSKRMEGLIGEESVCRTVCLYESEREHTKGFECDKRVTRCGGMGKTEDIREGNDNLIKSFFFLK